MTQPSSRFLGRLFVARSAGDVDRIEASFFEECAAEASPADVEAVRAAARARRDELLEQSGFPPLAAAQVEERLIAEFGYTTEEARLGRRCLLRGGSGLLRPFYRWWHTGELEDIERMEVGLRGLVERGFTVPAAFCLLAVVPALPDIVEFLVAERADPICLFTTLRHPL
jgi:hypothetical protein